MTARRSRVFLIRGDCREVVAALAATGLRVHSVVTDPPYHLTADWQPFSQQREVLKDVADGIAKTRRSVKRGFMGKEWDGGDVAFQRKTWDVMASVMLPGAHLLAFSGTRTYDLMVSAIRAAQFEIREQLGWNYASGMSKGQNIGKRMDVAEGKADERGYLDAPTGGMHKHKGDHSVKFTGRQLKDNPISDLAKEWDGWSTGLKPCFEPVVMARKRFVGTTLDCVRQYGTGAINIDATRIPWDDESPLHGKARIASHPGLRVGGVFGKNPGTDLGQRERVLKGWIPEGSLIAAHPKGRWPGNIMHDGSAEVEDAFAFAGAREAVRFFFCPKVGADERRKTNHPTVKPIDLMRWLVTLVTRPGGIVLDPFAGSGSTALGAAASRSDFSTILIEQEQEYCEDIVKRTGAISASPEEVAEELWHDGCEAKDSQPRKRRRREIKSELAVGEWGNDDQVQADAAVPGAGGERGSIAAATAGTRVEAPSPRKRERL